MKLPNFVFSSCDGSSKIGHVHDFSNNVVQKLKLPITHFYKKKCAHKQIFFNEKKNQKDSDDF